MKRRWVIFAMAMAVLPLVAGCVALPDLLTAQHVRGSGRIIEQGYELSGFGAVSIGGTFHGEIARGDEWSVMVAADDNVMPHVQVELDGDTLRVGLERNIRYTTTRLHVAITMPSAEKIEASGASQVAFEGFEHMSAFASVVSGASTLTGALNADSITLDVSGAGTATLEGAGDELTLVVSGASKANLRDLAVATANIALSGASFADVTVAQTLDAEVNGASELTYGGGGTLVSSQVSGGSRVRER